MSLDRAAAYLDSNDGVTRIAFLVALSNAMGIAARSGYVEAGATPAHSAKHLRGFNEMLLVTSDEIGNLLARDTMNRPVDDYIDTLRHWANICGCISDLDQASARALRLTDANAPAS